MYSIFEFFFGDPEQFYIVAGRKGIGMSTSDWRQLIDTDFPRIGPASQSMRLAAREHAHRLRGSVRLMMGKLRIAKDLERRRRKAFGH